MSHDPRFVTSEDGTEIAVHVSGQGDPLVLVYGALADVSYWRRLAPLLNGFELHAIERRGRGLSGDVPDHPVDRQVDDVAAVLASLPAPAHLFGHSAGATLALLAAKRGPELVRRMVLYEPPLITAAGIRNEVSTDLPDRLAALVEAGKREEAIETFFREGPEVPEADIQRQKAGPLWPTLLPLANTLPYDTRIGNDYGLARLGDPAFTVPALLLYGETSPAWLREGVIILADNLGAATVRELKGQGHAAAFTAPELLAAETVTFLRGA